MIAVGVIVPATRSLGQESLHAAGGRPGSSGERDSGAPCMPGTFDYGPVWPDPAIETIVLAHYGAEGAIVVDPADYARAARDVALILPAIGQTSAFHYLEWDPVDILIESAAPGECLTCSNQFYQALMYPIGGPLYVVTFPRAVNMPALARKYLECPEVLSAGLNWIGCAGSCGCGPGNRWDYTVRADGTWVWTIVRVEPFIFGSCLSEEWRVAVSAGGVVTVSCYADCDVTGGLDFFDFLCFQNAFAAGEPDADCDGSRSLDFFDFLCFQNAFSAGCP